jgi:SAM-dependent methyltransferase
MSRSMQAAAPARPTWKRAAGALRSAAYRLATPIDRLVRRERDPLLPPAHLRLYYYGTVNPAVFARACAIRIELLDRGLRPEHRVLDVGCGIGNLPIGLRDYLRGGYDGIDIHPEAVAWCQRAITPRYPIFRFHRADVSSHAYNPRGRTAPSSYRFPFADGAFDFIFLASVFTHMMPDDVEHYVRELSRMLAPAGKCVVSFFLLNDETRPGVDEGRSFMSFGVAHPSDLCRLHDASVPEAAVAFEESFVRRVVEQAGLHIDDVRRGRWWTGERHDQDVLTIVHEREASQRAGEPGMARPTPGV